MTSALSYRLLLLCLCALALLQPAQANEKEPWRDWQSPLFADHPLAGKIWSARDDRFITPEELGEAVRETDYLLLGEIHDNADHHRLQTWLVEQAARHRKPALVMEMIPRDMAPQLQSYLEQGGGDAAGLGPALDWEKRGWPEWRIYRPIADAALRLRLPIRAGNVDREILKTVGKSGLTSLEVGRRKALHVDEPLDATLQESLLDELFESHCQLMPRDALSTMSDVQRLRDAVLADSLIAAAGENGAILIAGNGHVRSDRAVPWFLSRRRPDAKIVTVMVVEVQKGADAPGKLVSRDLGEEAVADYVWFTPRAERGDPCEGLRKRLGKPRGKG